MSVENENRNCSCNQANTMQNMMNGMNDASLSALNNLSMNCENVDMSNCENWSREEMLKQIKCYNFAIVELGLYLDTHSDDEKAICLHNKYCKEYKDLTDKYQKVYGPLTIHYPCNKWRWIEEPWPWEGGMN